jgi:hypothetical protein
MSEIEMVISAISKPALMKPKADRYGDCVFCTERDLDEDGVPDGCMARTCICEDRRDPWNYISYNKALR